MHYGRTKHSEWVLILVVLGFVTGLPRFDELSDAVLILVVLGFVTGGLPTLFYK